MLTKKQQIIKRVFDFIVSLLAILITIVPLMLLIFIATISTRQFGLFVQKRIGKKGNPFSCYKIRTLKGKLHQNINEIVSNETKFGRWLRKSKLDELPQLFNVLLGSMSLVGPRPDIPGYADKLTGEDRIILSIRPGVTGPATIKYKNEDELLVQKIDPNTYNNQVIWPDKVKINKEYIKNWTMLKDVHYLWVSLL
ncbi:MAG: sugar transferase [Flavobacteriaceae bacterium]